MVLFAKDIVEKDFISLGGDVNSLEAAKLMKEKKEGFVVVVSPEGFPVGIVTEWDYLSKIIAENRDPYSVRLSEVMSVNPVTVDAEIGIDQVSQIMVKKGIRRVLVHQDGKVIGVITAKTILTELVSYLDTVSMRIGKMQGPSL